MTEEVEAAAEQQEDGQVHPIARAEAQHRARPARRPNGSTMIAIGTIALACGLIALGVGLAQPTFSDLGPPAISILDVPGRPSTINEWKLPLIWAGAGAANLGFLLWCVGQIVRAIYFLPGRTVTNGDLA